MSVAFSIFEEYSNKHADRKFTLATDKNHAWMKIFIWAKDEIDLVEELNGLNSLLVKYEAKDYYEFKVCLDHLLRSFVLLDQAFIFFCEKKKKKKWTMNIIFWLVLGEVQMETAVLPGMFI